MLLYVRKVSAFLEYHKLGAGYTLLYLHRLVPCGKPVMSAAEYQRWYVYILKLRSYIVFGHLVLCRIIEYLMTVDDLLTGSLKDFRIEVVEVQRK